MLEMTHPRRFRAPAAARGVGLYRPELDTLRFVAFFAVFVFHAIPHEAGLFEAKGLPPGLAWLAAGMVQSGAFGVDLFFCLSAFLITRLLIAEHETTGAIDIRSFYIRRSLRIWPLYFFALLIYQIALPLFGQGELSALYVASFAVFGGNWLMAFELGTPNASHLWSVSFEEQFYILWPLVILVFGVARLRSVALAMLVVAALARIVAVGLDAGPNMRWMNTLLRLEPLAVGIFLAAALPADFVLPRLQRLAAGAVGAVLPTLGLLFLGINTPWDMVLYPVVALGCGLLLLATLGPPGSLLGNRTAAYLGKISYGLYVYHPLCLWTAGALLDRGGFLFALGLNIAVSALSYRYLEAPFLRLKQRFEKLASRPV